jgi:hypothetical protein
LLGRQGMRAFLSILSAVAIAATLLLPSTVTARAQDRGFGNLVTEVQYRDGRRWRDDRRWRDARRWHHRDRYAHRPRHYGPRYRRGPSVDIIIGGGGYYRPAPRYIAPPPIRPVRPGYGLNSAHIDWCYARYRSYRASDNTFQPYHGPRRSCISPYG